VTSKNDAQLDDSEYVEVRCYFVRGRNALAVRADFGPTYLDHYLHLMQHGLKLAPTHDALLKDALAACTLHLASRPWNEVSAWTIHFGEPALNLFVTGNSTDANIVGRVFTEDVRNDGQNLFISQTNDFPKEPRRSVVEFDADTIFPIVEHFYAKSEQRLARFFSHAEEDFVFISAQPDCDEDWLRGLDNAAARTLDTDEDLSLLETRRYRHHCGCTLDRIVPALASIGAEEIFAGDDAVRIDCPRCAAKFDLTREQFDKGLG
jgi:molecular chaperone Hsp33